MKTVPYYQKQLQRLKCRAVLTLCLLIWGCAATPSETETSVSAHNISTQNLLATVHPLATEAGRDAFRRGGNAIDAAVAAALTLGVVDSHNSGIGGGCFMLIRSADESIVAIDGREKAPALAHPNMYIRRGKVEQSLSKTGALAVGVPGSLAAYDYALGHGGRLTLRELIRPAANLAERGFSIDAHFAERLQQTAPDLARFPSSRSLFLDSDGNPFPQGHLLKQPDLARTYRNIAQKGIPYFYGGPFAHKLEQWMRENSGILTARDFADYRIVSREPVKSSYRGYTIIGFPPPSSGGVHVAQILNILEHFDLKRLKAESPPLFYHLIAESLKPAFADRAYWLGDPDYVKVPRGLVDKAYAARLAARIDLEKVSDVPSHGMPPNTNLDFFDRHTTHIAAADTTGNWVAITTTLNTPFGSKVVIPGTGVVMNNQMDDFSAQPGVPNTFGLIGAEANSIRPGKRPLSSMSPTIVLKNGNPLLTLGAAGGPTIISQVVQILVNYIDLGMDIDEAVSAPRIHDQWKPDILRVEDRMNPEVLEELNNMGHALEVVDRIGTAQAVGENHDGSMAAVTDPRIAPLRVTTQVYSSRVHGSRLESDAYFASGLLLSSFCGGKRFGFVLTKDVFSLRSPRSLR